MERNERKKKYKEKKEIKIEQRHVEKKKKTQKSSMFINLIILFNNSNGKVLETTRLESRSGATYVGPDLCPNLFAVLQKVLLHQYPK